MVNNMNAKSINNITGLSDAEIEKRVQECEESFELHEMYKKHEACIKKSNGYDDHSDELFIDYNTRICAGCGAPIDSENNSSDCCLESFLNSHKRESMPISYIISVRKAIAIAKETGLSKLSCRSFADVGAMFTKYHKLFDHAAAYDMLRESTEQSCRSESRGWSGALTNIVKYEEAILGGVTKNTEELLNKRMAEKPGEESRWYHVNSPAEAANLLGALAVRYKKQLNKKEFSGLMHKCKDPRIKQELCAQRGEFRVSALRGTVVSDCLPSYYFAKRHMPEFMADAKRVANKLKFEKYENSIVALRYFMDYNLGIENITKPEDRLAIMKHIKPATKEIAETINTWKLDFIKNDDIGYKFVFGTHKERLKSCDCYDGPVLVYVSKSMEEYFTASLPECLNDVTEDAIADILNPR